MVEPSCPALVILDDDAFRSELIKTFDQKHFTVTFSTDGDEMVQLLEGERRAIRCGIIIIGEPSPEIRKFAPWVDETLLRPVDPDYVAKRARTYCTC